MSVKQPNTYENKLKIIKRLNERMRSTVRKVGVENEDYIRWAGKLTRPNSRYRSTTVTYNPSRAKLSKNKGPLTESVNYVQLSRKRSDIEAMDVNDLLRLEQQTRGWGQIRKEAAAAIKENKQLESSRDYNPFLPEDELDEAVDIEAAAPVDVGEDEDEEIITDEDIREYLNHKEAVREFIEAHDEAFYALIDATGWEDIREHTTEEIYREAMKIGVATYEFSGTLSEIGSDYITKREKSREHRRALGIL